MSTLDAPCWVVMSALQAERYVLHIEAAGRSAVPLAVTELRPPPDTSRLAAALKAREHDLALITSRHAPAFVEAAHAAGWQAACVGPASALAATERGFDVGFVGMRGAAELAQGLIENAPGVSRVLYLRGAVARAEATGILRAAGVTVDEVVAYDLRERPALASELSDAPEPACIVAGSPRAADLLPEALARLERGPALGPRALARGPTTAAHLTRLGFTRVEQVEHPGPEAVAERLS